jgi:hypothetical protein
LGNYDLNEDQAKDYELDQSALVPWHSASQDQEKREKNDGRHYESMQDKNSRRNKPQAYFHH